MIIYGSQLSNILNKGLTIVTFLNVSQMSFLFKLQPAAEGCSTKNMNLHKGCHKGDVPQLTALIFYFFLNI